MSSSAQNRLTALMNLHLRRRARAAAPDPLDDPRHGLPAEVCDRVATLDLAGAGRDVAKAAARPVHVGSGGITWPTGPPALPTAPSVPLTPNQVLLIEQDNAEADFDEEALLLQGYTEEDLKGRRAAARRVLARALHPDALAFYRPFTSRTPEQATAEERNVIMGGPLHFGIYLTTGGIERLAERLFLPLTENAEDALRLAQAFLLGHELGHLIVDVALADEDLRTGWDNPDDPTAKPLSRRHRDAHDGKACPGSEAFCQGYALQFLSQVLVHIPEYTDADRTAILDATRQHVADGLPGYRDGADLAGDRDLFDALVDVLDEAGAGYAVRSALLADLGRHALSADELPVHLVVTPGSAYARGDWVASFAN